MNSLKSTVIAWTLLLLVCAGATSTAALAQNPNDTLATPDWGDYPMLMSQFGELCTMCEAYVQCNSAESADQTSPPYTLYYFKTKTFWAQIATIWDYFAMWFDPVTSQSRPAAVYQFADQVVTPVTAYLSVADSLIEIDGTRIDRNTLEWSSDAGQKLGTCTRLGIPESMAMIENAGPWTSLDEVSP